MYIYVSEENNGLWNCVLEQIDLKIYDGPGNPINKDTRHSTCFITTFHGAEVSSNIHHPNRNNIIKRRRKGAGLAEKVAD